MFHMPAFVFVSGFFSKGFVQRGVIEEKRLIGFLVLYVVFMVAEWLVKAVFTGRISMLYIFSPSGAPWYLLCMFLWYLLILLCSKIRSRLMLAIAIMSGLVVGMHSDTGDFLALSRCIVFFPFFLVGYYCDGSFVSGIKPWMKVLASVVLLSVLLLSYIYQDFFVRHSLILYGASPYKSRFFGLLERGVRYVSAGILVVALLCVIPNTGLLFTYIGRRTIAIYIIHRLLRDICRYVGVYDFLHSDTQVMVFCIACSVIITYVCSGKRLTDYFNKAFSSEYRCLLRAWQ